MTNSNEPSLRELERDAQRDRADLMQTVDALQKRISPTAIKHDVKDYVRSKKDGLLQSLEQMARDNPVQTVAIAAGAAYPLWGIISRIPVPLLLIGAGFALTRRSAEDQADNPSFTQQARERLGETTDAARQKAAALSGAAQDQVKAGMDSARHAGDRLSEYAGQASAAVANIAAGIGHKAAEGAESLRAMSTDSASMAADMLSPDRVKRAGTQASDWANDTVSRNHLIVGALGLAIGAIIAAALPSTPQEDKLLGPAADDLKQKAGDAALEGVVAVKEIATEMYQEAASRAKEQGLSVGDAKEFVGQIGEKIKTAATNVTGDKAGDLENSPRPLPARPASGRTT